MGKQKYESDLSWSDYSIGTLSKSHVTLCHKTSQYITQPPHPPLLTKRKNVSRPTKLLQRLSLLINSGSSPMHTRNTETVKERNERGAGWELVRQWGELTLQLLVGSAAGRSSNWSLLGNTLHSLCHEAEFWGRDSWGFAFRFLIAISYRGPNLCDHWGCKKFALPSTIQFEAFFHLQSIQALYISPFYPLPLAGPLHRHACAGHPGRRGKFTICSPKTNLLFSYLSQYTD